MQVQAIWGGFLKNSAKPVNMAGFSYLPIGLLYSNNQLGVDIHDAGIQYLRCPGRTNDALNTVVVDEEASKFKAELPSTTRAPSLNCSL